MKRVLILCYIIMLASVSFAQKLTLDQSIQIALEQSPVMLKARAEIEAAEGAEEAPTVEFT